MDITLQRLQQLRNKGFKPKLTLDIGACVGEWTRDTKTIFPESEYLLLEANKDHEQVLKNTGYPYKIALLGNENKTVNYYAKKEGYTTGNSIFIEQTKHYTGDQFETRQIEMITLDSLLQPYKMNKPDFIKLDVQGAEILVLQGATKTLENCEFILLETQLLEFNKNAPMFTDIVAYMDSINFQTYDHLANHYLPNGDLMQIDVLFCKKNSNFIKKGLLC